MSIINKLINQIPELRDAVEPLPMDRRYLRKLSELAGSALQKNCDIMQLPSGDVVVSEVKTVYYTYRWDDRKGKFLRSKSLRKRRGSGEDDCDNESDNEELENQEALETETPAKKAPARRREPEYAD